MIFVKVKQHFEERLSMATDHYVENLNKIKDLAKRIQITDLFNPTPDTVKNLTEIIQRAKHIPELERMDFGLDLNIDNIEADA